MTETVADTAAATVRAATLRRTAATLLEGLLAEFKLK